MKPTGRDELEVLYVLLAYPVRSERFIVREIRAMRQLGVSVRIATIGDEGGEHGGPSDGELPVWRRPAWWAAHRWLTAVALALVRPRALARLLHAAFALAPEVVVLGTIATAAGETLCFEPVRKRVAEQLWPVLGRELRIVPAGLGEDLAFYAGVCVAREDPDR